MSKCQLKLKDVNRVCFISFARLEEDKEIIVVLPKNSKNKSFIVLGRKAIDPYIKEVSKKLTPVENKKLREIIGSEKTKTMKTIHINGAFSIVQNELKTTKYCSVLSGIQRMVFELVGR